MSTEIKVPALGESISEATLGQWLGVGGVGGVIEQVEKRLREGAVDGDQGRRLRALPARAEPRVRAN